MQRFLDTPGALEDFWDASRGHEGDPSNWSVSELQALLDDPSWLDVPRVRLLQEVTRRLDDLYRTFSPSYANVTSNINIAALASWEPSQRVASDGADLPVPLLLRLAGPLERCFNTSFTMEEALAYAEKAPPMGRHPLNDLRWNQLLIIKAYEDSGKITSALLQDIEQAEAMPLKVVGVRFLPPGRKLKAGDTVVCHNLHAHGGNMHNLNGLTASVVSAKAAAGTYTVAVDAAGGDGAPAGGGAKNVVRCVETLVQRGPSATNQQPLASPACLAVVFDCARIKEIAKFWYI
jgi:hypothetical protein